jgi:hypothetical protein
VEILSQFAAYPLLTIDRTWSSAKAGGVVSEVSVELCDRALLAVVMPTDWTRYWRLTPVRRAHLGGRFVRPTMRRRRRWKISLAAL